MVPGRVYETKTGGVLEGGLGAGGRGANQAWCRFRISEECRGVLLLNLTAAATYCCCCLPRCVLKNHCVIIMSMFSYAKLKEHPNDSKAFCVSQCFSVLRLDYNYAHSFTRSRGLALLPVQITECLLGAFLLNVLREYGPGHTVCAR